MSKCEQSRAARRRREIWLAISDHTANFLMRECGVEQDKAIEGAELLVKKLIDLVAGSSIYFAKDYTFELTARDEEICDRLERGNANDLAVEYGMSFVHIYAIARKVRARRAAMARESQAGKAQPPGPDAVPGAQSNGVADDSQRKSSWMYQALTKHLGGHED